MLVRHRDRAAGSCPAEDVARTLAHGRRGGGARCGRRGRRALHAGVHVGLVVVADVEHVVVALEHARTGSRSRCRWCRRRRPARSRARHVQARWPPDLQRRRDAGGHRRARCRTASGSTASATRSPGYGVEKTSRQPVALAAINWLPRGAHRGVDRVARAERFAATLARAMPGVERVAALACRPAPCAVSARAGGCPR